MFTEAVEVLCWIIVIAGGVATIVGVAEMQRRTKQTARRALAPRQRLTKGKPQVEITVEFGQIPPGPGILLIAAYQAVREEGKKYRLLFATRTNTSKTFYFEEA